MNKKLILLLPLCVLTLSSCINNKRTNIIVPGYYTGINSYDESNCSLTLVEISEEEYLEYDGINVIMDAINGKCYTIEFIINYTDEYSERITFENFEDAYDGATGTPISYMDSNRTWLTPYTTGDPDELLPYSKCYYSIYNSKFNISTYLYAVEE